MSNRRRTYTNAPNVTVNNPLSPTPAPSRPSSGASATTPRAAAPAPSAGAATGPPAAVAAVPLLCTPALLSCHSALLKATSGLSTALADWRAQFAVAARIIASLANVAPRWQTLAKEENERIAREERREANRKQPPAPLPLLVEEEGAFFFCEPLASDGAPGDEESARPPAVLGVLAAIPGLVSKLALQHERQIEIAWKLLVQTHSEFPSSYQCLSGIFDAVHDAYDLNKRVLTPAQLTAWCSTAPGASSSATSGSAHKKVASSAQKSGKKGSSSSSAAASVSGASSTSNGGSGKEEGGGNSVWNIMHHAEEIERMVQEEYDAHLVAWSDLHAALLLAGRTGDIATSQYELVPSAASIGAVAPGAQQALQLESPEFVRAWMHLDVERVLEAWTERHACIDAHAPLVEEHLRQLRGRAPKYLTDERTWQTSPEDEEEREEQERRERRR